VISPKTKTVVHTYTQPECASTGLVLNPTTQQLLAACGLNTKASELVNARNGKVVTRFPQISGTDEEWYDPGMNLYFSASAKMTSNGNTTGGYITPEIAIISGGGTAKDPTAHFVGTIPTSATANQKGVAVDATNHEVFSPAAGTGIEVYKNLRVYIGG